MILHSNSSGIGAEVELVLDVYIHSKIIMVFETPDQAVLDLHIIRIQTHYHNNTTSTQPTHCDQILYT